MKRKVGVAFAIGLACAASAAQAKPKLAEAVLVSPAAAETQQVIDGRVWRCLGTGCRGAAASAPKSQSLVRECSRLATRLGAVTMYRSGGKALGPEDLARCNAGALGAEAE